MHKSARLNWIAAFLCLLAGGIIAEPVPTSVEQGIAADERVLFASGHPQPWEIKTSGMRGGKSERSGELNRLLVSATKPGSGGGISLPTYRRFDPMPYLDDVCMRLQIRLRIVDETEPTSFSALIQTVSRMAILSAPCAFAEVESDPEGWQVVRFGFPAPVNVDADDLVSSVTVLADRPCRFEIDRMSLVRYRNVSLRVTNPLTEALNQLQIQGETVEKNTRVVVVLTDARGKKHQQVVASEDGRYAVTWTKPPVTLQDWNQLSAHVEKGINVMDRAINQPVFGYRTNNEHLWLKVEGTRIVTSEQSAGGKRPFIPVGIGYARNVIIPAQDEGVAAFCKAQHLNTIRLPFYSRFFNNRQAEPIDLDYHLRTFVDPVIDAAKRHGLYVLLDEHGYFSERINEAQARQPQFVNKWDEKGVNEWALRWGRVADYYKDEPHVLGYELCNEPHDIDPQTVRDWYGRAITAIRKVDTRHIVFVGTCDWSHARALERTWGGYTAIVDQPYNNVVFAFHEYPTDNHPWQVQPVMTQFRDTYKVPVLCTEFGASWWDHDETTCRDFQAGLLGLFAKEDVGWMVWALKKLENNPRSPHPLPKKIQEALPPSDEKPTFDSCAYSDIWSPIARIMGSPMPEPRAHAAAAPQ